jgi:signal peptidase II
VLTALLAGGVVLADQLIKQLVVRAVAPGAEVVLIPGILWLTHVRNTGIAFGLLRGVPLSFLVAAALTVIFLVFYNWTRPGTGGSRGAVGPVALGALAGGAGGNLFDRVRLGYVIDYLDLRVWPVFNLADAAVVIGGALLLVAAVRQRPPRTHRPH